MARVTRDAEEFEMWASGDSGNGADGPTHGRAGRSTSRNLVRVPFHGCSYKRGVVPQVGKYHAEPYRDSKGMHEKEDGDEKYSLEPTVEGGNRQVAQCLGESARQRTAEDRLAVPISERRKCQVPEENSGSCFA